MVTARLLALGAVAALAACASNPEPAALTEARSAYTAAAADPAVAAGAPMELARAREALTLAEAAYADGETAETSQRAYVASRQVQIARETAMATQARSTVATADLTRGTAVLQARNAELERQLAELQAERTERGIVMTLGDVLFAVNRAELTPGAEARLDRLAEFLRRNPDRTVRIEGYADATGAAGHNLDLSERRAAAVRDALTARGVSPGRVVAQGFGEARPVASNATESGRQANRRVEVVISDLPGNVAETRTR
ncbi:OmpA family protein [Azospirillum sp.]|uniref:OmpA family protein n=1 Tax=Azospirillum sp. TaxID=34012 RepID=UPI002D3AB1D5|nr:OmpA family protein [Azospirillum sp.]HYD66370.1 OmpA family protein [Azospirillum sp.]